MKRVYFILWIVFMLGTSAASAQTLNQLYNSLARKESVEKISLGKFSMGLVDLFSDTYGVNKVEIMNLPYAKEKEFESWSENIRQLEDPAFETLVTANDKGEFTRIMLRMDQKIIKELVIMNVGREISIIRLLGKIKPESLAKLRADYGH